MRCLVMGAAGRDFHDFLSYLRHRPEFEVVAFTATQIPFIDAREFPVELAGPEYTHPIPIFPESQLVEVINRFDVEYVFLAYSDLAHVDVMHKVSIVQAAGAAFAMLGPKQTQLESDCFVVAVTGTRTGVGKSPISQMLASRLQQAGRRVAVIRHPMPYGNLVEQRCQKFSTLENLDREHCTVEEQEEYAPYIELGIPIFAGVDYRQIVNAAQVSADLLIWDGGNNDTPFLRPDVWITVADALRPGHELAYYPGETNFRAADVIVINKVDQAPRESVDRIRRHAAACNPGAVIIESNLQVELRESIDLSGKRVLVIEDGPTLTHGGMPWGAGMIAVQQFADVELVDPRPHAVGTIRDLYEQYPHLGCVLPACGYSAAQISDLEQTMQAASADVIVDASPCPLERLLRFPVPQVRVRYRFVQQSGPPLVELIQSRWNGD